MSRWAKASLCSTSSFVWKRVRSTDSSVSYLKQCVGHQITGSLGMSIFLSITSPHTFGIHAPTHGSQLYHGKFLETRCGTRFPLESYIQVVCPDNIS